MVLKLTFLVAFAYLSYCDAEIVSSLQTCFIKDEKCLKELMENIVKGISKSGIPDYNIPPTDPLNIDDINVLVLNTLNVSTRDVIIEGFKDLVVKRFDIQAENGKSIIEIFTDLKIKGKYLMSGSNSFLEKIFGSNLIHGNGNFKVKLKNFQVKLILQYHLVKKSNGDVHFKLHKEDLIYNVNVDEAFMEIDKLFLGKNDASKEVMDFFNQYWPAFKHNFGDRFFYEIVDVAFDLISRFSDSVPSKYYFRDDLTSFARSDM